jgi:hypothetical protein
MGNADQPVRIRIGQRLEQNALKQAEDRGARSDTDRQRQYADRGETDVASQSPRRVFQIATERIENGQRVHVVDLLSHQGRVAELSLRGRAGPGTRHPAGEVVLGLRSEMELDFLEPFSIPPSPPKELLPGHGVPTTPMPGS